MEDYPWVLGIFYILTGPIIALFGKRWFPYVVGGSCAVCTFFLLLILFSVFGWMSETLGLVICLVVALALSVLVFWIVKRTIWLAVGVLGAISGYFLGTMIYALILVLTGYEALWLMILSGAVFAVLGGFVSYKCGKALILLATSGLGSYVFVRGWAYFFGGWAGIGEMMSSIANDEEIDVTIAIWIYLGIFVFCFIFAMCYQSKREKDHPDLEKDEFYKRSN